MSTRKFRTRRRFVAGGLAGLAAAPFYVPASALGWADDRPASERVTLGCIGVGGRGTHDMKRLMAAGGQIVAACDVQASARERVAQLAALPAGSTYVDFRDLLARGDVDAVMCAVPEHWHVPIGLAAVRAGKDLYLEKPLGITIAEGQAMLRAVRRYGCVFMHGTEQRARPETRHVCELIRNGRIGKLHTVYAACPGGRRLGMPPVVPVPAGLDWDRWLGPAPDVPYRGQPSGGQFFHISDYTAAGFICNWGVHILDIIQWAMGTDDTGPFEVSGSAVYPPASDLSDTALTWKVELKYANGVTVHYTDSSGAPPYPPGHQSAGKPFSEGAIFVGTEGKIGWSYSCFAPYSEPASILGSQLGPNEIRLYEATQNGRPCTDEACFVESVRTRTETCSPIEAAHRSTSLGYLADIACRLGRKLRWDPQQEHFPDDPEANRLLSRSLREPWSL